MSEDAKRYRTSLEFTTESKDFEAGASKIEKRLEHMAEKSKEALGAFSKGLGSSILGGVGLGIGQKLVSGFGEGLADLVKESFNANRELGVLRKGIAGTLMAFQSWKPGVDMVDRAKASMRDAREVTEDLEEAETRLAIPLDELATSYRYLGSSAIQQYGQSQKQATNFTIDAAAAAKALGSNVEGVSFGITRLLETRSLRGIDPVTNFLRGALGRTKDLKNMAPDKLFALIGDKLHSLVPAAEEMSNGMGGAIFRFKHFWEVAIRDIGGPAFELIGKKVAEWQRHFDGATGGGKRFVEVMGKGVLVVVEAIATTVENVASGVQELSNVISDLHLEDTFDGVTGSVREFWGAFNIGAEKGSDFMDAIRGAGDGLYIVFSALKLTVREVVKFVDQTFTLIETGINKVLALVGKQLPKGSVGDFVKEFNPITGITSPGGLAVHGLRALGRVSSKDVGDGSMFGEWGKMYADRVRRRELRDSPVYGPPTPGHVIPDTSELTRRGHPVNNFYGDIKVNQQFKDADPDDVWIQLKEALEGAAESTMVGRGHHPFASRVG